MSDLYSKLRLFILVNQVFPEHTTTKRVLGEFWAKAKTPLLMSWSAVYNYFLWFPMKQSERVSIKETGLHYFPAGEKLVLNSKIGIYYLAGLNGTSKRAMNNNLPAFQ